MNEERSISFKTWRVAFLCAVLFLIVLWGWNREQLLESRKDWGAPLQLGVIVVERAPVDPALIEELRAMVPPTQSWIRSQSERYRTTLIDPVQVHVIGSVASPGPIPKLPIEASYTDIVKFTWNLWRWRRAVDASITAMPELHSKVYLIVSPQREGQTDLFFEGIAEQGGEVGLVEVDLASKTVFLAIFTAVHEFLHTLGATDKYSYDGRTIDVDGLGEPDKMPLYPQTRAEIMGRNIVVAPGEFEQPTGWSDVVVGAATAAEIGWTVVVPGK